MSWLSWHQVRSDTLGIYVERSPALPIPQKKIIRYSIPGRNGDVIIDTGAYENVTQKYSIYLTESANVTITAKAVKEWLLYQGEGRLVDSFDPDVYRFATYEGGGEIENVLQRFGRAEIEFDCRPQRYVLQSLNYTEYTEAFTLTNPTQNNARPVIRVNGSGAGTLTVGNNTIALTDCNIYIDSELQSAFLGTTNKNNAMTGEFPILPPGETGISWTGGITSILIAPRWFYL